MPYDPNYPPANAEIESAPLRSQFHGLFDLIQTGGGIANAHIDSVNTVDPYQSATVSVTVSGNALHFSFAIPRGHDGNVGAQGQQGDTGPIGYTGPEGQQGPPGEVSLAQLDAAIAGTSSNSNGVSLLNLFVSDPPTQAEVQAVVNKVDELIQALRRW